MFCLDGCKGIGSIGAEILHRDYYSFRARTLDHSWKQCVESHLVCPWASKKVMTQQHIPSESRNPIRRLRMRLRCLSMSKCRSEDQKDKKKNWLCLISRGSRASLARTVGDTDGDCNCYSIATGQDSHRTLGNNFTVRIFCQVRFCRCKIGGLELVFGAIDLNFKAVY